MQEEGGLISLEDLAAWKVRVEEPVMTTYRGIEVYKLTHWTQGPAMLQALNILENFDLKGMGFNSARYIHALYQAMNLAFADRDFYYGDPYFPPEEPIAGLLSKQYAKARAQGINWERNDPGVKPGDQVEDGPARVGERPRVVRVGDRRGGPAEREVAPVRHVQVLVRADHAELERPGATIARSRRRSSEAPRPSRRPTSRAGWSRSPRAAGGSRR